MKFAAIATSVLSLALLNTAHAGNDGNRALVEARWYTLDYLEKRLAVINPGLLKETFPGRTTYAFVDDVPGYPVKGANLLREPSQTLQGAFMRWPDPKSGNVLATAVDDLCVKNAALGLRSLYRQARQVAHPKPGQGIVIAGISTGELKSAPQDLDRTPSRNRDDIRSVRPRDEGRIRCNVYRTVTNRSTVYDISVVMRSLGAYWK